MSFKMPLLTPIQTRIFDELHGKDLPRRELVRILKTARTTIYDNLVKLQKKKLVEKYSKNNGIRGRPLVLWTLYNNLNAQKFR